MIYQVTVPTGCAPGDIFQVEIGKELFDVNVPVGCGAGSCIEMRCGSPVDDSLLDEIATSLRVDEGPTVQVQIPVGYLPGDELLVDTPDGRTLAVIVPSDGLPGTWLEVALPDPPALDPLMDDPKDGWGAMETDFAAYKSPTSVRHSFDGGGGAAEYTQTGYTTPSDCDFDFDDSYLIQRSDGTYSEGWIKEYDESCDMYHVLIVGVGYKWVCREQIECNTVHY